MRKLVFIFIATLVSFVSFISCKKYEDRLLDADKQAKHLHPQFTAEGDDYYAGDTVYFTNNSTSEGDAIVEYFWHFGFNGSDGQSFVENPFVVYEYSGKYAVKLTVTDAKGGYATKVDTLSIRPANGAPNADFIVSPEICNVNEEITFIDISTDEGTIVSRQWNFGNDDEPTDSIVRRTFTETGLVTIALTVTDERGLSSTIQKTINIRSNVDPGGFVVLWTETFETSSTLRSISPAVGGNGDVYVASNSMRLHAYSPTGVQQWTFDMSANASGVTADQGSSPIVAADGTIYIGVNTNSSATDICMFAVNPDGSQKWAYHHNPSVRIDYTTPTIGPDGHVFIGTRGTNGRIHKINKDNGSNIWRIAPHSGGVSGAMVVDQNSVIYSGITGDNSGLSRTRDNLSNGVALTKWGTLQAAAGFAFAIDEDAIYIGWVDGTITAFDITGETAKWTSASQVKYERGGIAISTDGRIYAGSANGASSKLVCLNKATGAEQWAYTAEATINSTPAIDNLGNIHFGDNNGNYYVLNPDGTERHKQKLGSKIESSPVISDYGTVYVTVEDGGACKLIAIDCGISGPADSPWAQRGQNARRSGLQK